MTQEECQIMETYLKTCERFGVKPVEDYKEVIKKAYEPKKPICANTPERKSAIAEYLSRCRKYGITPTKNLDEWSTSKIINASYRYTDITVAKVFSQKLSAIPDDTLRVKIKNLLKELYDQFQIVDTVQALCLLNARTDMELVKAFRSLGGVGTDEAILNVANIIVEDESEDEYEEE